MYRSIQIDWSPAPSEREKAYKDKGLMKTQGTIYLLPPDEKVLRECYTAPPRPKTRTSSGAVALTKHFQRAEFPELKGKEHPFWPRPRGSNEHLTELADTLLEDMLNTAVWRNVMMLHPGVAVYEIRNKLGYGMRWTINIEDANKGESMAVTHVAVEHDYINEKDADVADRDWNITNVTFRGFLEPIEGLNGELVV